MRASQVTAPPPAERAAAATKRIVQQGLAWDARVQAASVAYSDAVTAMLQRASKQRGLVVYLKACAAPPAAFPCALPAGS